MIEIQTEYSQYPQPRIATSVSIRGQVLHKIQKDWGNNIESLEEMRQAEELINRQHDEVATLVNENGDTILKHAGQSLPEDKPQSLIERAEAISEVRRAFIITSEGVVHGGGVVGPETEMLAALILSMTEFISGIAAVTNLGDADDSVLHLGSEHLLLVPYQDGYLGALVAPEVKKKEILDQLHQLAGEACNN